MLWIITALLFAAGIIGVFAPFVPGLALIYIGVVLHAIPAFTDRPVSWIALGSITLVFAAAEIFDKVSGFYGAKYGGMTKAGFIGGILGAIAGLFVGGPVGLLLGPPIGLFVAQIAWDRHRLGQAGKASAAYAAGMAVGLVVKLLAAGAMITILLFSTLR